MDYGQAEEIFLHMQRASVWREEKKSEGVADEDMPRFLDPENTWVDDRADIGKQTLVYPFCVIMGDSVIGARCIIFPHTTLLNVVAGDDVTLGLPHQKNAVIGEGATLGSMAEFNRVNLGKRSKALHHSYLGDATLEDDCNVGAGFITANYDGQNKYPTRFGTGSFLGVNANVVAPNDFPAGTQIAAGSTIVANLKQTRSIPPFSVIISRAKEIVIRARKLIP